LLRQNRLQSHMARVSVRSVLHSHRGDGVRFPLVREREPDKGAERAILIYIIQEQVVHRVKAWTRAIPRCWGDIRIKARKSFFEFIKRAAVPIRLELITYESEGRMDIQEDKSLNSI
jgi:hypothetical protein